MCSASHGAETTEEASYVPVYALEAAVYTIPSTSTSLIYISKVDTTGILATPAPSRAITTAFLQYHLLHPPNDTKSLRLHIFARSQGQYLFPSSVDNKGKRVLGDSQLQKWWRSVLGDATTRAYQASTAASVPSKPEQCFAMYYMLGGCSFDDSLGILSRAQPPVDDKAPEWEYGHPYASIPSPLPGASNPPTLNDLIPAFQDDPKARQLTEWASSPIPYAGQDGDYDEIMEQIHRLSDSSTSLHVLRAKEMLQQREEERTKLLKDKDMESFWLVMGNRGECGAGHIAGFFVVVRDCVGPKPEAGGKEAVQLGYAPTDKQGLGAPEAALPYASYVKLWSAIHNVDYSSTVKASQSYRKWLGDVKSAASRHGIGAAVFEAELHGSLLIDNPNASAESLSLKRSEPPKQVNTLMVKKKKKV